MVAIGFLSQNFERWWGTMNNILSFYEYRFSGEVVGNLKPYLMQKNLFELFALTGSGDAKTLGVGFRGKCIH